MGTLMEDGEDATGLLYRRNRYYDPEAGQFTQEDPIGIAGGLNLYGYADGDPVKFSDPFGLCPEDAGGDGETENYDDCPEGTSGWYAHRLATGEGNALLNMIGGTLAACGESSSCQGVLTVASLGGVAGATRALGSFKHFGFADDAASFAQGLRQSSYATWRRTTIEGGEEAAERLALATKRSNPDAVYVVTPKFWRFVRGPRRITPANGRSGGGWEFFFPSGTAPGTVRGPFPIR